MILSDLSAKGILALVRSVSLFLQAGKSRKINPTGELVKVEHVVGPAGLAIECPALATIHIFQVECRVTSSPALHSPPVFCFCFLLIHLYASKSGHRYQRRLPQFEAVRRSLILSL